MADIYEYNLNLDPSTHPIHSITIKQYGKNIYTLNISITQKGSVYVLDKNEYKAYLKMIAPDDTHYYIDCDINDQGIVVCTLPESVALKAGTGKAEVEVISNDGTTRIPTCTFEIIVDSSVYDEEVITNSDDFSALVNAVAKVNSAWNKNELKLISTSDIDAMFS